MGKSSVLQELENSLLANKIENRGKWDSVSLQLTAYTGAPRMRHFLDRKMAALAIEAKTTVLALIEDLNVPLQDTSGCQVLHTSPYPSPLHLVRAGQVL